MAKRKTKNIAQASEPAVSYLPLSDIKSNSELNIIHQNINIMSLTEIIALLKKEKRKLYKRFNIKHMALFGSYVRHEQTASSDVDIMVEFNEPIGIEFIELADTLEKILKTKVDLVSKNAIKPNLLEFIERELIYV